VTCYLHPERDATEACNACSRMICRECDVLLGGGHYCKKCLAEAWTVQGPLQEYTSETVTSANQTAAPHLYMPQSGRVISGVIAGISRSISLSPGVLRIVTAVLLITLAAFGFTRGRASHYAAREQEITYSIIGAGIIILVYLLTGFFMRKENKLPDGTVYYTVLRRSRADRTLAGVLGGIAQHLGFNSTLLRICYVGLTVISIINYYSWQNRAGLFIPATLILYIILWLLIPRESEQQNNASVRKETCGNSASQVAGT
jgi:phage shock protein C